VLGGALCLALAPFQSYLLNGSNAPFWVPQLRPIFALYDRFYMAVGLPLNVNEYYFYGRMFIFVYALALVGLAGVHSLYSGAGTGKLAERLGFWTLAAALATGLIGDALAYWGGHGDFNRVQEFGFSWVEVPSLLAIMGAAVLYGLALLRAGRVPWWSAILLTVAGPAGVPSERFIGYLPHGALLPFSLAIALLGLVLLSRNSVTTSNNVVTQYDPSLFRRGAARQHSRASR
jgi:hypothetical protein